MHHQMDPDGDLQAIIAGAREGDTIEYLPGVYTRREAMLHVRAGTSGLEFVGLNQGVLIDALGVDSPCLIAGDRIGIDGFDFKNGKYSAVSAGSASGLRITRCVGWNEPWPARPYNSHVWSISKCRDVAVEACAGFGSGRNVFLFHKSEICLLMNSWFRWDGRPFVDQPLVGSDSAVAPMYECRDVDLDNVYATATFSSNPMVIPPWYATSTRLFKVDGNPGRGTALEDFEPGFRVRGFYGYTFGRRCVGGGGLAVTGFYPQPIGGAEFEDIHLRLHDGAERVANFIGGTPTGTARNTLNRHTWHGGDITLQTRWKLDDASYDARNVYELRVFDELRLRPLGIDHDIDVRVIAASLSSFYPDAAPNAEIAAAFGG